MKCKLCRKPILLVPSAAERAAKFGGQASDYTKLFTTHASCAVAERSRGDLELLRKISGRGGKEILKEE